MRLWRKLMFALTKWLVRKYFSDGVTARWGEDTERYTDGLKPIMGSAEWKHKIIAWEWRFYDEKYEQYRNRKREISTGNNEG